MYPTSDVFLLGRMNNSIDLTREGILAKCVFWHGQNFWPTTIEILNFVISNLAWANFQRPEFRNFNIANCEIWHGRPPWGLQHGAKLIFLIEIHPSAARRLVEILEFRNLAWAMFCIAQLPNFKIEN